jgi:hypothetical protein
VLVLRGGGCAAARMAAPATAAEESDTWVALRLLRAQARFCCSGSLAAAVFSRRRCISRMRSPPLSTQFPTAPGCDGLPRMALVTQLYSLVRC